MPSSPKGKNVAVIGAGPSGLTAVKALLEEGHRVICFEKSQDIGGVYRYAMDNVGVYESAQLTSSALITSFSDFPPPPKAPFHFKHDEYLQYLRDYANHFGLMPFIKFNHVIQSVERQSQETWALKVFDQQSKKAEQYTFDAIAVCAGAHQNLSVPPVPNKEIFRGSIIHSGQYKTAQPFKDKNVVVVGGGESGSDIIEEISKVTQSCMVSLRRGVLVIPRLVMGLPNDYYLSRLYCASPQWFFKTRHKNIIHWPTLFLIILFILIPINILVFVLYSLLRYSPVLISLVLEWGIFLFTLYTLIKTFRFLFGYIGHKESVVIRQLSDLSGAGHDEQFATKCQGIAKAIARKKCSLKPEIKKFTAQGVEFIDATNCKADAVIFCTGYATTYPFLAIDRLDCRDLYKNCFNPSIGPTLCFLGLARPAIGAIPPISEMQARWFAQILSGKCHLPPLDMMKTEIAKDAKIHRDFFAVVSDRITGLVDFSSYMDQLAQMVGCKPRWKNLWKDPILLYRLHFNPFMACQYRLVGPHQKKELARKIMTNVSLNIFQILSNCFIFCLVSLCEILTRCGFKYFKPHLRLE